MYHNVMLVMITQIIFMNINLRSAQLNSSESRTSELTTNSLIALNCVSLNLFVYILVLLVLLYIKLILKYIFTLNWMSSDWYPAWGTPKPLLGGVFVVFRVKLLLFGFSFMQFGFGLVVSFDLAKKMFFIILILFL